MGERKSKKISNYERVVKTLMAIPLSGSSKTSIYNIFMRKK